jgi:hypothetical protein
MKSTRDIRDFLWRWNDVVRVPPARMLEGEAVACSPPEYCRKMAEHAQFNFRDSKLRDFRLFLPLPNVGKYM